MELIFISIGVSAVVIIMLIVVAIQCLTSKKVDKKSQISPRPSPTPLPKPEIVHGGLVSTTNANIEVTPSSAKRINNENLGTETTQTPNEYTDVSETGNITTSQSEAPDAEAMQYEYVDVSKSRNLATNIKKDFSPDGMAYEYVSGAAIDTQPTVDKNVDDLPADDELVIFENFSYGEA